MKLEYFHDELRIPGLEGDEASNQAIKESVNDLITTYETEFLKLLLGYDSDNSIYETYIAGVAAGTAQWVALQSTDLQRNDMEITGGSLRLLQVAG